tara:strand:+ start:357 stop:533 length:177 start_codon:yes stop_codon:yes gene_type:complete
VVDVGPRPKVKRKKLWRKYCKMGGGGLENIDFEGREGVVGEGATLHPKIYNVFLYDIS